MERKWPFVSLGLLSLATGVPAGTRSSNRMFILDDKDNQTWYWIGKNNKKTYANHIYWNWQRNDPNFRTVFDSTDGMPQTWDHSPVVPILAVVMLAITVFLLVLFRQNPGLVAGTVAGCLIIIGMYLTLNSIQENKLKFE